MTEFQELRYPFLSLGEFLAGGYWLQPAALHLTLGLLFQVAFVLYVISRQGTVIEKATTCYFSLALYNNFAYSLGGLRIGELAGVVAALAVIFASSRVPFSRTAYVSNLLALCGGVILIHALVIGMVYPSLDAAWSVRALRFVLIGKIFTLALVGFAIERHLSAAWLRHLVRGLILGAVVACALYLLQLALYTSGVVPYGTFWDAGFTGIPSFGSVSIERGHFGKFLVPLFPFFFLLAMERRRYLLLALFLLVCAINFSASSIAFLLGYLALTAIVFAPRLLKGWGLLLFPGTITILVAIGVTFWAQYQGIMAKIMLFAIDGGEGGGRGLDVLAAYLRAYPLGTSYGGSTLRTVGALPEINMGAFVFVAQFSYLAVPLALAFFATNVVVLRHSVGRVDAIERKALSIGVVMAWIIFGIDVLWFVPTIWAPLMLLSRLSSRRRYQMSGPT